MTAKLVGLLAGVGFGFVLAWARVTDPVVIRKMLLLREPDVFLIMGSAIVVAGIGVRVLRILRMRSLVGGELIAWSPSPVHSRHVVGSALFGAGWSVTCTCPGPVGAMIGQGHFAGLIVGAGLMSGIVLKHRLDARAVSRPAAEPSHATGL